MKLTSASFLHEQPIPEQFAFGAPDPVLHIRLATNHNPHLKWTGAPAATRTFSNTVIVAKTRTVWKVRTTRARRAMRFGFHPTASSPKNAMRPALGRISPLMMFSSVVLPAPLGPQRPTRSPAVTCQVTASSSVRSPNLLVRPDS